MSLPFEKIVVIFAKKINSPLKRELFIAVLIELFSNRSSNRASACTSTAVNACISVDNVLSVSL